MSAIFSFAKKKKKKKGQGSFKLRSWQEPSCPEGGSPAQTRIRKTKTWKSPPNKTEWESAMACLRVLELYSGIGGMHCALKGKLVIDKVRNKLQTLFTKTRVRPFDRYSSFTRISICTSVMLGTMTSPRLVLFVKLYY